MREKGGCFGRGSGRERRSSKRKEGGVPDDGAGGALRRVEKAERRGF